MSLPEPFYQESGVTIYQGNCLELLKELPAESVQCCVTSPPYWGLRDYKIEASVWGGDPACAHQWGNSGVRRNGRSWDATLGESPVGRDYKGSTGAFCACGTWRGVFGLEPTPALYVEHSVMIFREVRRVLRSDGTLWLNLGDSYATNAGHADSGVNARRLMIGAGERPEYALREFRCRPIEELKPKDLVGIPWRVAFALQADGWYLRSDIIWSKPNPMPESVTDRPTKAHEYLFLLVKSERYHYDAGAIKEPASDTGRVNGRDGRDEEAEARPPNSRARTLKRLDYSQMGRNKRSVWTIATEPYPEAHFATFPEGLVRPCILAGCARGGTVLDPFMGSGTALAVAKKLGCQTIGLELNPAYCKLATKRVRQGVLNLQEMAV